jgi:hypothetical protein
MLDLIPWDVGAKALAANASTGWCGPARAAGYKKQKNTKQKKIGIAGNARRRAHRAGEISFDVR